MRGILDGDNFSAFITYYSQSTIYYCLGMTLEKGFNFGDKAHFGFVGDLRE